MASTSSVPYVPPARRARNTTTRTVSKSLAELSTELNQPSTTSPDIRSKVERNLFAAVRRSIAKGQGDPDQFTTAIRAAFVNKATAFMDVSPDNLGQNSLLSLCSFWLVVGLDGVPSAAVSSFTPSFLADPVVRKAHTYVFGRDVPVPTIDALVPAQVNRPALVRLHLAFDSLMTSLRDDVLQLKISTRLRDTVPTVWAKSLYDKALAPGLVLISSPIATLACYGHRLAAIEARVLDAHTQSNSEMHSLMLSKLEIKAHRQYEKLTTAATLLMQPQ